MPLRIQLSRRKGFRLPPNTVVVARPTRWGNPVSVSEAGDRGRAVDAYRAWLSSEAGAETRKAALRELKDRDLACWCPLGEPCHADVLLTLVNAQR